MSGIGIPPTPIFPLPDTSTWINGIAEPNPLAGSIGDYYLNTTNGDIYEKTSAGWGSPKMSIGSSNQQVTTLSSVALLKAVAPTTGKAITLSGYYAAGDGGGGVFHAVSGAPGAFVDNGGTIIVPTGGNGSLAWRRTETSGLTIRHFGASENQANNTPFILAMLNAVGYVHVPKGTFNCTSTIVVPGIFGQEITGEGKEVSKLVAVGLSGSPLVSLTGSSYYRFRMHGVWLSGDCLHAVYGNTPNIIFETEFSHCRFDAINDAIHLKYQFSTSLSFCGANSVNGHSFYILGGNTVSLRHCYAYDCGSGKSGYRIIGSATLYECNGINDVGAGHSWGAFGDVSGAFFNVLLIGCNIEDFGDVGLYVYSGRLKIERTSFVARQTGTFETYIKHIGANPVSIFIGSGTTHLSKGATMTASQPIVTDAQIRTIMVEDNSFSGNTDQWSNYYSNAFALTYPCPKIGSAGDENSQVSLKVNRINADRDLSYRQPQIITITPNASTFSATGRNALATLNNASTNIDGFTGGVAGQRLTLHINDSFTTLRHGIGGAGRFNLWGGVNYVPKIGDVFEFEYYFNVWVQVGGPQQNATASLSLGTLVNFTVDAQSALQHGTNNGAVTITAPTRDCRVNILITNGASAGAITLSGFTILTGGASPTTTNGHRFMLIIARLGGVATAKWEALQ